MIAQAVETNGEIMPGTLKRRYVVSGEEMTAKEHWSKMLIDGAMKNMVPTIGPLETVESMAAATFAVAANSGWTAVSFAEFMRELANCADRDFEIIRQAAKGSDAKH